MIRILLLPLDERPCNYRYPLMITQKCDDIELRMPPKKLLGNEKEPADFGALAHWIRENFADCNYAVISVDMLVYGGIVPSRLHYLTEEECASRLSLLTELHTAHPEVKMFAFNLIMRAPAYSSADEEPEYYGVCGAQLWRLGVLKDRACRSICTEAELAELSALNASLAPEVVSDFCHRRNINHKINLRTLSLLKEGILDFLVIPMDDCAPFGWAPMERQEINRTIRNEKLGGSVFSYSGADEVGCILTARAVNQARGITPSIYPCYSSVYGSQVVPRFEDRPLGENLKWLIAAAGGRTAFSPEDADFMLMVNAPTASGTQMGDVNLPINERDTSYENCRCLPDFAQQLQSLIGRKSAIVADLSMANGADEEWMDLLEQRGLLSKLYAYSGWNTAANAAGTCIAQGMICNGNCEKSALFTCHRILEDWLYMGHLRKDAATYMDTHHLAFDGGAQEAQIADFILQEMRLLSQDLHLPANVVIDEVTFPWHRLFEIDLLIHEK